jgi:hypothetical protein
MICNFQHNEDHMIINTFLCITFKSGKTEKKLWWIKYFMDNGPVTARSSSLSVNSEINLTKML